MAIASGVSTSPAPSAPAQRLHQLRRWRRVGLYALIFLLAVCYAFPFFWAVSLSLKPVSELDQIPPRLLPIIPTWSNYPKALFDPTRYFPLFFYNTVVYVGLSVLGKVLSCTLVAFGFARIPFKGRTFLFVLVLSTMMLPDQVLLIPQFLLFKQLGWLDSIKPLVIPNFFASAFYVFLLRQFFMSIPRELDEAAVMDGAGYPDIYWRIILPLSMPVLITVVALSFVGHWNEFFGPLIYINGKDRFLVAMALRLFIVPGQQLPVNQLMAASVATLLPVIVVFLVCQRYIVRGVTLTGLREG
jgi:ABC-type glycerol-3-phosphate transport system permease component